MKIFQRFTRILWLLFLNISFISTPALSDDYIISISQIDCRDFPQVNVYVSVINNSGQSILGLKEKEFEVFEDNSFVKLTGFILGKGESFWDRIKNRWKIDSDPDEPITTVLVIDRSGSMEKINKIGSAKEAAINFVNKLKPGDKTAVVIFDNKVDLIQDFTSSKDELTNKIGDITTRRDTALCDAVYFAIEKLKPIRGRKSVIALTDGLDNSSSYNESEVVQFAIEGGIPVYTIGLGNKGISLQEWEAIDEEMLQRMSVETGGRYFFAPSPDELISLYDRILEQIKNEYYLSYISPEPNVYKNKRINREVMVKVTTHNKSYQAKHSYNPDWFFGRSRSPYILPGNHKSIFAITLFYLIILLIFPITVRWLISVISTMWFSYRSIGVYTPELAKTTHKCPIDLRNFKQQDKVVICPKCKAVHHKECWEWNYEKCGGCLYSLKKGGAGMSLKMRVYYYTIFGAIGGIIGAMFIESFLTNVSPNKYIIQTVWGGVIGALIGGSIGMTEGFLSESFWKSFFGLLSGGMIGGIGGAIGPPIGEWVFEISGGESISRILGWTIFGMLIGAIGGIIGPEKSSDRAAKGLLGGAMGGFIGGLSFKYLSIAFATPTISRAFGLLILGACIGFAIALVQFILKEAWLIIESARKLKGKEFLLDRDINSIGSDHKRCNIFLPGDSQIFPIHATLKREISQFVLEDMSSTGTFLNRQKIDKSAQVKDGDRIRVGEANLILRISERRRREKGASPKDKVIRINLYE